MNKKREKIIKKIIDKSIDKYEKRFPRFMRPFVKIDKFAFLAGVSCGMNIRDYENKNITPKVKGN